MNSAASIFLGIEGGGTRTTVLAADENSRLTGRKTFGAGNIRLLNGNDLQKLFDEIACSFPPPAAIGIGMAGVRDEQDKSRIRAAAEQAWGGVPLTITHDLEIALRADPDSSKFTSILLLSGTGSCAYGRNPAGHEAKVGGWGHILGDLGSGYQIALSALRGVIFEFDRNGKWSACGRSILGALALNEPEQLIDWIQYADKAAVASLARCVFESARRGDPVAMRVAAEAAESLARDALVCARRLAAPGEHVNFLLAGGVLLNQRALFKRVRAKLLADWPRSTVRALKEEGAWGAVKLAMDSRTRGGARLKSARKASFYMPEFNPALSPTEQRNPASMRFDQLAIAGQIDLMLDAEQSVVPALKKEKASIALAVNLAAATLKKGGRIFYVGAGTSGRLGVLDASECAPTFRASPEMIQGIIAGGQRALWQSVEGAEDHAAAGARALEFRGVTRKDLVVGIAASGRTPFVWGAIAEAKRRGAKTVLLCFNPSIEIARARRPDLVIAPDLGPEILTGSTRLKCGTATKIILNMISTIAMTRLGKVLSNLMVDLHPSNAKLRDRAVRILQQLADSDAAQARAALERSGWVIKAAWADLRRGIRSPSRPRVQGRARSPSNS